METFSASLALYAGNSPVIGGFPLTKASDAELWYFIWSVSLYSYGFSVFYVTILYNHFLVNLPDRFTHICRIRFAGNNCIIDQMYYSDVIMSVMAPQTFGISIVYSTVWSCFRSKKTSKLDVTGLCGGKSPVTSQFPSQRVSNAENASIWWRHYGSEVTLNDIDNIICCQTTKKQVWIV